MKRIYIDMDNVLCDFGGKLAELNTDAKTAKRMPGFFLSLEPMPGAIDAVKRLMNNFDVYVLSTSPWSNPYAVAEKLLWIKKYIPEFYKRVIFSHHKNLCQGDYLIDDSPNHGANEFNGKWIQFGDDYFKNWDIVVNFIEKENNI